MQHEVTLCKYLLRPHVGYRFVSFFFFFFKENVIEICVVEQQMLKLQLATENTQTICPCFYFQSFYLKTTFKFVWFSVSEKNNNISLN